MRLERAIITGLKGIYRKSGAKQIDINFNACLHDIILISGPNGSGKSSLMMVLNPLPDNQEMYIEGMECSKKLFYRHENVIYTVTIIYPVDSYGNRTSTKAYLTKESMGEYTEYNSNGNVRSYKDCIYQEFGLDPNFIALSRLSSENRGIVDRTPAERKKYVNLLLDSTTEYDNMYKVLYKRSSNFKAMVNSIVAKIDTIGDYEYLCTELKNLCFRINTLQNKRDDLIKQLADAEAAVKVLDPDKKLRQEYQELDKKLSKTNEEIIWVKTQLIKHGFDVDDNLESISSLKSINLDSISSIESELLSLEEKYNDISIKLKVSIETKAKYKDDLTLIRSKIENLSSENLGNNLEAEMHHLNEEIATYDKLLDSYKDCGMSDITESEFMVALNSIKNANEAFSNMKSSIDYTSKEMAIAELKSGVTIDKEKYSLAAEKSKLEQLESRRDIISDNISTCMNLIETMKVLSDRPKNCKDDNCPFIVSALKAKSENPHEKFIEYKQDKASVIDEIREVRRAIALREECIEIMTSFIAVEKSIFANKIIFDKLPNNCNIASREVLLSAFEHSDGLSAYITCMNALVDWVNALQLKKVAESKLKDLAVTMSTYNSNIEAINSLRDSEKDLVERIDDLDKAIAVHNTDRNALSASITENRDNIKILDSYNSKIDELIELYKAKIASETSLAMIEQNIRTIEIAMNNVNTINSQLLAIKSDLEPLDEQYREITFSIERYKEYSEELKIYQDKFNLVETLKKFTSPSKDGIQNLFIKLYMGTTLNLANELLQMMFNGEMKLLDYVINEKEFRIPCKSEQTSIINNDISSCSTGEKCMISLVLGTVLSIQSSSKYNIFEWDEMDNGLDKFNKGNFIPLTRRIMDIFKIEQCIMISHATESVFEDVDIISLGPVNNEIPKGNVIFSL